MVDKPLLAHVVFQNTGKTPALYTKVQGTFKIFSTPDAVNAIPNIQLTDSDWAQVGTANMGTVAPNSKNIFSDQPLLARFTKTDYASYQAGHWHAAIFGRVRYCDVYKREHWMTWCNYLTTGGAWGICENNNEIDSPQDKPVPCSLK